MRGLMKDAIEGLSIELSPEEAERYQRRVIEIRPSPELDVLSRELRELIELIAQERHRRPPRGETES